MELRQWAGVIPMGGAAAIGPMIDAWSRFTGNEPNPEELGVLFEIDGVLRSPPQSVTLTLPESMPMAELKITGIRVVQEGAAEVKAELLSVGEAGDKSAQKVAASFQSTAHEQRLSPRNR
jgi:hypothetical protein